jgi:hypothetical protein
LPENACHASELLKRAIPIGSKTKQLTKRTFPPCPGKIQLKTCPRPQTANKRNQKQRKKSHPTKHQIPTIKSKDKIYLE